MSLDEQLNRFEEGEKQIQRLEDLILLQIILFIYLL
jgi:hypothetical protein